MSPNPEQPPNEGNVVKCPKCGHEFAHAPGWLKASIVIGCPKCGEQFRVREPEGN
jgi:predicted  nucleic acid-binding Zn-ribbon protein